MVTARLLLLLLRLKNSTSNSPRLFSSSAAPVRRPWTHFTDDSDGQSSVYKRALKLQRPATLKYHHESLHNFVSLIGTIEFPFRESNSPRFGVRTWLKVQTSTAAYPSFRLLLQFWDEMAEMSVQHLRPHDFVYVSGHLGSYMKVDEHGKSTRQYKVDVMEVNFVAQQGLGPVCQNSVKFEPQVSAQDVMQKRRDRLHLWQVFFSDPSEWWDNRKDRKPNSKSPHFKHKDTGEALWLNENDPPWIKQQLQLHDSRLSKQSPGEHRSYRSHLSPLVYDDAQGT